MTDPHLAHRQSGYALGVDWGLAGAKALGPASDIAVVVDVLSFTTTLTVAADRGVVVFPYRWRDDTALRFARSRCATLAVGRSHAGVGEVSLSPASVRNAPGLERLVLPSPNGSTISAYLDAATPDLIGVSLRNRHAAARWLLARRAERPELRVAVIAAGEHWPDGSLRPAVEDLWGAGALIASLGAGGWGDLSPEAHTAAAAFTALTDVAGALAGCASGRELIGIDHADDVDTAAELDSSRIVPGLRDGAFVPV